MRQYLPLAAALGALAFSPAYAAPDRYHFDHDHTNLLFFVSHLGFSNMVGRFTAYDGSFTFDPQHPETSHVEIKIKPAGIVTSSAALDKELQSTRFFNTAQFPEASFVSTGVKVTGPNEGDVTGNFTLLGITHPLTFRVHFNKADWQPYSGAFDAGFTGDATLSRAAYGMTSFSPMVGDEVRLHIEVEGISDTRAQKPKGQAQAQPPQMPVPAAPAPIAAKPAAPMPAAPAPVAMPAAPPVPPPPAPR